MEAVLETQEFYNNSGQSQKNEPIPPEIKKWNWGAFFLNWIWAIPHGAWVGLILMFVPFVNFIVPFVFGMKGNQWAWKNNRWESVEQFNQVQKKWAKAGVIVASFMLIACVGLFFLFYVAFKDSKQYRMSVAAIQKNPEVIRYVGQPFTIEGPQGFNSSEIGPTGEAQINILIKGPKAKVTVSTELEKNLDRWRIHEMVLLPDNDAEPIALIKDYAPVVKVNQK
jgi:Cytochrome oxidase complex assembly protein 1